MDLMDNLSLAFAWPNNIHVNFEANQLTPRGYAKVGEEFTGTKGTVVVSRQRMVHYKGPNDVETLESKRDITYDGVSSSSNGSGMATWRTWANVPRSRR